MRGIKCSGRRFGTNTKIKKIAMKKMQQKKYQKINASNCGMDELFESAAEAMKFVAAPTTCCTKLKKHTHTYIHT